MPIRRLLSRLDSWLVRRIDARIAEREAHNQEREAHVRAETAARAVHVRMQDEARAARIEAEELERFLMTASPARLNKHRLKVEGWLDQPLNYLPDGRVILPTGEPLRCH